MFIIYSHFIPGSLSSLSLPGQVSTDDDVKGYGNGKSLQSDTETITTRTSGYTSGIMQDMDSDIDSMRGMRAGQQRYSVIRDASKEEDQRPASSQSRSSRDY